MNPRYAILSLGLIAAFSAGSATTSRASAPVILHVTLDTSPLVGLGNPPAPFSLDFQLNDGSNTLDGVNTVTLSHFQFGGGSPSNDYMGTTGNATGDLATKVTLKDDAFFFNDFFEKFVPGSVLSFDARITTNVDTGDTPDEFSFALQENGVGESLPTTGPADALLTVDIDGAFPTIQTYGADPDRTSILLVPPTVQLVPEPGALAWLVIGGAGFAAFRRRKRNQPNSTRPV